MVVLMLPLSLTLLLPHIAAFAQAQTAVGGPLRVEPITVEEPQPVESAYGPVTSYRATPSATATKTDIPLIETPQSISVIRRDRLEAQDVKTLAEALRYTAGVQGEPFGLIPVSRRCASAGSTPRTRACTATVYSSATPALP